MLGSGDGCWWEAVEIMVEMLVSGDGGGDGVGDGGK